MHMTKHGRLLTIVMAGLLSAPAVSSLAAGPGPAVEVAQARANGQGVSADEKDYYVDKDGALHIITRRLVKQQGGLYSVEGDDQAKAVETDKQGRLFYRDAAGAVHYVEETEPGVYVEKKAAPKRSGATKPAAKSPRETCESQYRNCVAGCRAISPREAADQPNCMRDCETIRRGCSGR